MPKKEFYRVFAVQALQLVRLAALAPSRHNTQPWKFSIGKGTIRISPDFSRSLSITDPEHRGLYLSLGCATENIHIAATHYGLISEISDVASSDDGGVSIHFAPGGEGAGPCEELMAGIALRQCNRRAFDCCGIPPRDLRRLVAAGRQQGVHLAALTDTQVERVAQVVEAGKRERLPRGSYWELASWTRFSKREARRMRDGLMFFKMGYPSVPRILGLLMLRAVFKTKRDDSRSASLVRSSPALISFSPERQDAAHWFLVGRSFQRIVLTAASLGICYAHLQLPFSSPVHFRDLAACLGCSGRDAPMIVRLGYSDSVQHSPRRPLSSMLRQN